MTTGTARIVILYCLGDHSAVDSRHDVVKEDEVYRLSGKHAQGLLAIGRTQHLEAFAFQNQLSGDKNSWLIINRQNGSRPILGGMGIRKLAVQLSGSWRPTACLQLGDVSASESLLSVWYQT